MLTDPISNPKPENYTTLLLSVAACPRTLKEIIVLI